MYQNMSNKDIPAFPTHHNANDPRSDGFVAESGMKLRDYFAAAALTGFLAKGLSMHSAVQYSYEAADQMLIRREKQE